MRTAKGHLPIQQPKPLAHVAPEALTGVLSGLEDKWSRNALGVQQRFGEAIARDDAQAAQKWAIAAGISTEKVLLMKGRPTEIVANLHAHRHELGDVMDKLAIAARVGGVLLVARKNKTLQADITRMRQQLIEAGATVVGAVLVDFQ